MVDPRATYEAGRISVSVERRDEPPARKTRWLVCASRRQSEQFVGASAVAWCESQWQAYDLARMIAGVERTRDGGAVWPDERADGELEPTDQARARDLLLRLLEWEAEMGGWSAPAWREARAFIDEPRRCVGCSGKRYRLATRGDGERSVERCDACSPNMTDDEALVLSGYEGTVWIVDGTRE